VIGLGSFPESRRLATLKDQDKGLKAKPMPKVYARTKLSNFYTLGQEE
jgi:hypothetical protein